MSAGYVAVTIIFFVLALGVCLLAYRYYTRLSFKTMPLNCAFWQALSLYVCVVPFPLLVMDIDAALYARDTGAPSQTWMRPIWITIFAVSYWCAWITLPVAQMYTEVGEFTYKGRLIHSIKLNLKLYGAIVSIILIVFVYLLILKGAYTSTAGILKIAISLANTWGLLILTLFMPAGLVGVPRMLWRNADARKLLRRRLFDVIDIQEDLDLAAMDLSAVKSELISIDPLVSDENRPHLGEMLELIATTDREVPQYHIAAQRVRAVPSEDRNDISLEHLELLHAKLKRSIKIVRRASYRWTSTVRECQTLDAIIAGPDSTNNQMKRIWYTIRTYVYWAGFGVTTFLTLVILWSELVLPFRQLSSKPLGLVEVIMHSSVHFVASIIFLFYMAYCAYWAAFQFKVFDVYVIYPDIADNASLCFNECFLVRLLMPLCFNFLLISGLSAASTGVDVEYGHVYRRNMDISMLFGEWFNRFLPALIPFLSIIVFFNLAQRLLSLVGVEVHDPNDVESPSVRQRILDGKRLVEIDVGHELTASVLPDGDGETTIVPGFTTAPAAPAPPMERGQRYKEYLAKKERKDDDEP